MSSSVLKVHIVRAVNLRIQEKDPYVVVKVYTFGKRVVDSSDV